MKMCPWNREDTVEGRRLAELPIQVPEARAAGAAGAIDFVLGACRGLEAADGNLSRVRIAANDGGGVAVPRPLPAVLPVDDQARPIADWGLNLDENRIAVDTEASKTSVPDIFSIGDINPYPGKLKLILSGSHEAALMA